MEQKILLGDIQGRDKSEAQRKIIKIKVNLGKN